MSERTIIKKALSEIAQAETASNLASKLFYSARKRLESISSPTAPAKGSAKVDALLTRRNNKIKS